MENVSQLLTERQVAALTSMSVSTIRRWRLLNEGPPFRKIGKSAVRYSLKDVTAWITARPMGGSNG